jgi:hypothetical protein
MDNKFMLIGSVVLAIVVIFGMRKNYLDNKKLKESIRKNKAAKEKEGPE